MESFAKPSEHDLLLTVDGCASKRKRGGTKELTPCQSTRDDGPGERGSEVYTGSERLREVELSAPPSPEKFDEPLESVIGSGEGEEESRSLSCVSHGSVSVIGRRRAMEDAVTVAPGAVAGELGPYDFFGVYDGHGSANVANACRDRLHKLLLVEIEGQGDRGAGGGESEWRKVMEACFEKMDEEVAGGGGGQGGDQVEAGEVSMRTAGSTAVVAMVGKEEIVVANCGDSRAVLCRGDVAVPLSHDHKPDRPDEKRRVEAAGGKVVNWNGSRVLGVLATSRSIGDYYLKPYVISKPDVTVSKRTETDNFLIIASDGLWDVVSNEVACMVVRRCLDGQTKRRSREALCRNSTAAEAAVVLTELAMARGSRDNISVIVVELRKAGLKTP